MSAARSGFESVKFLVVDDDDVSIMKIKRTFRKAKLENPVFIARDGIEALEMLRGDCGKDKLAKPYIVTLDINMPRMDGHEFLEELRNDETLRNVVVFILSTSESQVDIDAAYDRHVAGYILKENTDENLVNKIMMIERFSSLVILPN